MKGINNVLTQIRFIIDLSNAWEPVFEVFRKKMFSSDEQFLFFKKERMFGFGVRSSKDEATTSTSLIETAALVLGLNNQFTTISKSNIIKYE